MARRRPPDTTSLLITPHQQPPASIGERLSVSSEEYGTRDSAVQAYRSDQLHLGTAFSQLAIDLAVQSIRNAIEEVLDFALFETGAEEGEILFAEPQFRELALIYHRNAAPEAFTEIVRFQQVRESLAPFGRKQCSSCVFVSLRTHCLFAQ